MKSKALAVRPIPEMTENLAKGCQIPGHTSSLLAQSRKVLGKWPVILRSCISLVFFLGLTAALGAQTQKSQWSDLSGLKVGQGIDVIETSMKSHGGTFVSVTDEVITLREKNSDVSVKT